MMKTLQDNLTIKKIHLFATTLLLIFSVLVNTKANAQCHQDDWTALKAFYENTNWSDTSGWHIVANHNDAPDNCDLGSMNGITLHTTLDIKNGRVKVINLREMNLSGNIPTEIGDLTYLTNIDLHTNFLTGSIPTEIGNLTNLEVLTLSNNYLSGILPTEIGYLTKLRGLHLDNSSWFLGNNQVTGNIPEEIGNLVNLETLYLSRNNFTGSIPNSISNLTKLLDFYAEYNQLTGEIPEDIGNLTDLKHLILYSNQISGNLPDGICELTTLEKVILTYNQLEGEIPDCLGNTNGNLSTLYHFDVSSNKLTGSIPPNIGNLTNLIHLAFSSNKLTGNIPLSIGSLTNMENFGIGNNFIDGSIPQNFVNLSAIEKLWMDDNNLSGSIPAGLGNLSNLTTVYFNGNNLSGAIPAFANSSTVLRVQENYFSCSDIENFNKIQGQTFEFEPQYITPINYDGIKSYVVDSMNIGIDDTTLSPSFANAVGYTYQWKQNGVTLNGATNPSLTLQNIQPEDAGRYTLHITDASCAMGMEFVADPIFVIVEGYDLYGQEVEYNQVMVEFDSPERTTFYEDLILDNAPGSYAIHACDCNRELYLWQFPTTEAAIEAMLIIDKKLHTVKDTEGVVDGGFNNRIVIGQPGTEGTAINVFSNFNNTADLDDVTIFLLDTGLDQTGDEILKDYLMSNAPVDGCYTVNSASGYNYTSTNTTIDDNYVDEVWHGTFGYNSITQELDQSDDISIVPLKIFDENGEGNLFDLTCAIYHAIDHNADIINLSAGYQGQRSSILENAINTAREKGVFICTAAGNDTINIDITPQYPAYFASQYHYIYDVAGEIEDSVKYDNVISVASINAQNNFSAFSNEGQESVTLSAYGEDIQSYGLGGEEIIASGTSMSTYFVSRELALEISTNKNRGYQQIWSAFEANLIDNPASEGKTITGKRLNVDIQEVEVETSGPICRSNARFTNPLLTLVEGAFARFAQQSFTNNFIKSEKAYIKHQKEIHRLLASSSKRPSQVKVNFDAIKDVALSLLYQSFTNNEIIVTSEHLQLVDAFLISLNKATNNQDLKNEISHIRKYMHVAKGKELKRALIDFDQAGEEDIMLSSEELNIPVQDDFSAQIINALGRDAYLVYQSNVSGSINIQLFNVEGSKINNSYQQVIYKGHYQHALSKQYLAKGIYYVQINFKAKNGTQFNKVLKLSVAQ